MELAVELLVLDEVPRAEGTLHSRVEAPGPRDCFRRMRGIGGCLRECVRFEEDAHIEDFIQLAWCVPDDTEPPVSFGAEDSVARQFQ